MGFCTVEDNLGSGTAGADGGGIYGVNSEVIIWNSRIEGNTASTAPPAAGNQGYAGGIYVSGGHLTLTQSEVVDNVGSTIYGGTGGIEAHYADSVTVLSSTIRGNRANMSIYWSEGGGLEVSDSSQVLISGNWIESNHASNLAGYGGGLYIGDSDAHITRNRIVSNTAGSDAGSGGGVYIRSTDLVTLSNNIIARNHASSHGGGVAVERSVPVASVALLVNNTIADNGATGVAVHDYANVTMTNNIIAGHSTGLMVVVAHTGTVHLDTNLFWNASDPMTGTDGIREAPGYGAGYRLLLGSPALDAGDDILWLSTDVEGNPRTPGEYDLGALEGIWLQTCLPLVLRD